MGNDVVEKIDSLKSLRTDANIAVPWSLNCANGIGLARQGRTALYANAFEKRTLKTELSRIDSL
jgi:hypothetical protein